MTCKPARCRSNDGTSIAYDRAGDGPAIITVVSAFNDRSTAAPLTTAMQEDFTVYTYDRRGRGDSGDTAPYAVAREVEDLQAILTEAGGSAAVFGFSSGESSPSMPSHRGWSSPGWPV